MLVYIDLKRYCKRRTVLRKIVISVVSNKFEFCLLSDIAMGMAFDVSLQLSF